MSEASIEPTKEPASEPPAPRDAPAARSRLVPAVLGLTLLVLGAGCALVLRQARATNDVTLASQPRGVTVVKAAPVKWRLRRRYVGTLEPWLEARVGPQMVSAYVQTVLVRPGDHVKRGDVIATLDCRSTTNGSASVVMQARSLEQRQFAIANEAARLENLKGGGFVSENEMEQKRAQVSSESAQLEAIKAQLRTKDLEVSDCTLRASFNGEVATRTADPGSFARPGSSLVTIIDRHVVRVVVEAPEIDFVDTPVGTPVTVRLLATGQVLAGAVSRRSPSASAATRTVRFEVDLADSGSGAPTGTTADVQIEVGAERDAVALPLVAGRVRGEQATVFVVDGSTAHKIQVPVVGERDGTLFVGPELKAGSLVATEGRGTLSDGDTVASKLDDSWLKLSGRTLAEGKTP